jgi:hypothetical protein
MTLLRIIAGEVLNEGLGFVTFVTRHDEEAYTFRIHG